MFTATRAAAVAAVAAASMLIVGVASTATTSVDAPIPTPTVSATAPEAPQASPVTTTADPPFFCITGPGGAPGPGCVQPAVQPNCECEQVLDAKLEPLQVTPGKQVVLLIHGINDSPKYWDDGEDSPQQDGDSLAKTLAADTHVTVGRYDYRNANGLIDDPAQLAETLKCLAEKSGKKVSVVGYSRGGLLAQRAMGDHDAAKYVEGLVSIATPWHLSLLPRIPADVPVMAVGTRILSAVPPVECPMPGMHTYTGDGCFEDWQTTNPSGGNVVNRTTLDCVHIPIVKGCKSHKHQWLKTNRDLVKPVSEQLNKWREKAEADTSVVKASASGCGSDTPKTKPVEQPKPVPRSTPIDNPPDDVSCPDGWTDHRSDGHGRQCWPPCPDGWTTSDRHVDECWSPCPDGLTDPGAGEREHRCRPDKPVDQPCPDGAVMRGDKCQPSCPNDVSIAHGSDECQPNPPTGHPGPCPPPMVGPGPSADGTDSGCWLPGVPCVAPMVGPGSDEHGMGCWLPGQGPADPPIQVPPVQVDPVQPAPVPAQTPCPPGMTVPGTTQCFGVISPGGTPQEQAAKRQQEQETEQAAKRQQEQETEQAAKRQQEQETEQAAKRQQEQDAEQAAKRQQEQETEQAAKRQQEQETEQAAKRQQEQDAEQAAKRQQEQETEQAAKRQQEQETEQAAKRQQEQETEQAAKRQQEQETEQAAKRQQEQETEQAAKRQQEQETEQAAKRQQEQETEQAAKRQQEQDAERQQEQAAKRQQEQAAERQQEQAAERQQEQAAERQQEHSQTGKQKTQQEQAGKKRKCEDGFVYDASLKECVQQ